MVPTSHSPSWQKIRRLDLAAGEQPGSEPTPDLPRQASPAEALWSVSSTQGEPGLTSSVLGMTLTCSVQHARRAWFDILSAWHDFDLQFCQVERPFLTHLAGPVQLSPQGLFCGQLPTPPRSWPGHPPRHPPAAPDPRACPPSPCSSPMQSSSGVALLTARLDGMSGGHPSIVGRSLASAPRAWVQGLGFGVWGLGFQRCACPCSHTQSASTSVRSVSTDHLDVHVI